VSIIYDALQKTENKDIHNKHSPKSNKLFIIIVIAALVFVLILSGVLLKKKVFVSQRNSCRKTVRRRVKFAEKKYTPGSFVLEGIIYNKGFPTAVINGKVLKEGDSIGDFKVQNIGSNSVQLIGRENKKIKLVF